jgi:glutamate-5-semialdehyde dehydrogenase
MYNIEALGKNAVLAEQSLCLLPTTAKNYIMLAAADLLAESAAQIIEVNAEDIKAAQAKGSPASFVERLTLNPKRIDAMCEGLRQVAALPDPVGEVIGGGILYNGLNIVKRRVPLGVVGVIFESRPNVTVDAAALCFKAGCACILRGGSEAIRSNILLAELFRQAISAAGENPDAVQMVTDTSREVAGAMMKLNRYIDVLIPRGGKGLINNVVQNATVPVIQTGEGVCHAFVDGDADLQMALNIVDNAKTQRPSVCNAIETLLVHENVAGVFLPAIAERWQNQVQIFGDDRTAAIIPVRRLATEEDYYTEYNDYMISVKVVADVEEAIRHINTYGTKHSECIITQDMNNAARFQNAVDAAAVYVNASTRFTDGFEFGLGAEIGISNQKLHARGPLGLKELTTCKYLINGNGQIRT